MWRSFGDEEGGENIQSPTCWSVEFIHALDQNNNDVLSCGLWYPRQNFPLKTSRQWVNASIIQYGKHLDLSNKQLLLGFGWFGQRWNNGIIVTQKKLGKDPTKQKSRSPPGQGQTMFLHISWQDYLVITELVRVLFVDSACCCSITLMTGTVQACSQNVSWCHSTIILQNVQKLCCEKVCKFLWKGMSCRAFVSRPPELLLVRRSPWDVASLAGRHQLSPEAKSIFANGPGGGTHPSQTYAHWNNDSWSEKVLFYFPCPPLLDQVEQEILCCQNDECLRQIDCMRFRIWIAHGDIAVPMFVKYKCNERTSCNGLWRKHTHAHKQAHLQLCFANVHTKNVQPCFWRQVHSENSKWRGCSKAIACLFSTCNITCLQLGDTSFQQCACGKQFQCTQSVLFRTKLHVWKLQHSVERSCDTGWKHTKEIFSQLESKINILWPVDKIYWRVKQHTISEAQLVWT